MNSYVWPIVYLTHSSTTQTGSTTPGQSGPGSNSNGVLHITQSSGIGASSSEAVFLLNAEHSGGVFLPFCRDAVNVLYSPSRPNGKNEKYTSILYYLLLKYIHNKLYFLRVISWSQMNIWGGMNMFTLARNLWIFNWLLKRVIL